MAARSQTVSGIPRVGAVGRQEAALRPDLGQAGLAPAGNPKRGLRQTYAGHGWVEAASSRGYAVQAAVAVAASRSAFQFQGSSRSSSRALVRPETMRSSTSVNHARGSTPF